MLDKVSQLVPKTYHWRSEEYPNKKFGTQKEYGLVAQDVEKIFPDMVENDANGLKAIHYERLPILAVQAIKELKTLYDHEKSVSSDLSLRLRSVTGELAAVKTHCNASLSSVAEENAKLKDKIAALEASNIASQKKSQSLEEQFERRLNALEKMQIAAAAGKK